MTDAEDPFGDLDESLADEPDDEPAEDEAETETIEETATQTPEMQSDQPQRTRDDAQDRPAFPFDEVRQSALYARDETWDEFEAAMNYEAERSLHEDGYSNIEGRELHEAALLVAAENPELVAEKIRELRKV